MLNIAWGLINGWLAAAGVAIFPLIILAVTQQSFEPLDEIGGVGRYLLWCSVAGTAVGLTLGIARRFSDSSSAARVVGGLIAVEIIGSQLLLFEFGSAALGADDLVYVIPVVFVVGAFFGPIFANRLKSTWPNIDRWLGGLQLRVVSEDPNEDRHDSQRPSSPSEHRD